MACWAFFLIHSAKQDSILAYVLTSQSLLIDYVSLGETLCEVFCLTDQIRCSLFILSRSILNKQLSQLQIQMVSYLNFTRNPVRDGIT